MQMKAQWAMQQQDRYNSYSGGGGGFGGGSMAVTQTSFMQQGPSPEHLELAQFNQNLNRMYLDLMIKHRDLLTNSQKVVNQANAKAQAAAAAASSGGGGGGDGMTAAACLGVIRLDYDYPPAPGDIDSPQSFGYDVYYRVVPGLTFSMCQAGKMTPAVEAEFCEAIDYLLSKGVSGITGDCGFMMYFQKIARMNCTIPVFMSSLAQLPAVTCAFNKNELIAVLTANSETLKPMRNLIKDECGVDPDEKRFIIVGCQDVPGFEAVALGQKVNVAKVTPGMVEKAKQVLNAHPTVRAFLLECTELPPYADALRAATRLPVYDAITGCDFFISGKQDNERFGIQGWQKSWDGQQDAYKFGDHLDAGDKAKLVNKIQEMPMRPDSFPH
jgi:hypothetical protein